MVPIVKDIFASNWDPFNLRKRILILISWGLDSILVFIKHFLSVLNIYKFLVFFLRTSGEYWKKCRQGSIFTTDPTKRVLKTDPCPYPVKYSLYVLKKKTKVLDIFNMDKKCFIKINIESCPPEIWIRIRFHNGSGTPSLVYMQYITSLLVAWVLLLKCYILSNS